MKKSIIYSFVLIVSLSYSACAIGQEQNKYQLTPLEFQKQLQEDSSASIIDVRSPGEYSKGHIANALNVDWNGDVFEKQISRYDKAEKLYVYCLSGGRSATAIDKMKALGFTNVVELKGGISQWRNAGLPETKGSEVKSTGITKAQFDMMLTTDKLVLIDFYAVWCAPCKRMEPYLEELKTEMEDIVVVVRIDADANPYLFKELKVEAIPALLLYKDKKLIWSNAGYISKEEVLKQLQ